LPILEVEQFFLPALAEAVEEYGAPSVRNRRVENGRSSLAHSRAYSMQLRTVSSDKPLSRNFDETQLDEIAEA